MEQGNESDKRNKKRRSAECTEKRAEQIQTVAQAVVFLFFQEKMVGNYEQVSSKIAKGQKKNKEKYFRRMDLEKSLEEKEKDNEPELDEKKLTKVNLLSSFAAKSAQEESDHKRGQEQGNSAIEIAVKRLKGDDNDDFSDYGREAHDSQRDKEKICSFSSQPDDEQKQKKEK